ncbi:dNTP triphosphohydrolase [Opitutaceae bacterium TAV4]|nr:dNTP triphosphohydrolase [Opitutaceae bacterium TAV4]RRJ98863.1 dNTP triphosphohydrolase [Opitutaceae bacterium TAV3]
MANTFYNDFDQETWGEPRKPDYRTPFQIDRDRVIHSHAFRKLQSKTQVFLSGEYDFYRTRLTHSMEVAQIGRSICSYLLSRPDGPLAPDFYIDPDLVEAIGLSHDLGHPPFGHAGERTLQELMADHGGFEGNAQTLHLLTDTIYEDGKSVRGMSPTRAFMDGVLKYKKLYGEYPQTQDKPEHHFLYDTQGPCRDFVFGNNKIPDELHHAPADPHAAQPLNKFKSIECQIMDWADDTAYSLNDIVDGVRAGFLTLETIEQWASTQPMTAETQTYFDELTGFIRASKLERVFAAKIGKFIQACALRERTNFMSAATHRYRFELVVSDAAKRESRFYKDMALDLIFRSPQLQQMEHKGRRVLRELWRMCWDNYVDGEGCEARPLRILPPRVGDLIQAETTDAGRSRQICDWLAGLTDGAIVRTYKRMTDPDFGSIRDLN